MKLASGVAPLPELLAAGVNVSLGTDGCASNNNLDLLGELASVATLHKVKNLDATVVDAAAALEMATANGARALGFGGGRLEAGAPADLVVLDGDAPNLVPVYNPVSHVVYSASGPNAKHVVVNGQIIVRDFKCLTVDEAALLRECRALASYIRRA
jgi:5-methylthioadenosine/S-adenosylhomocysteine deaminase